jgi:GNAT superfamily N-acetyltransferase
MIIIKRIIDINQQPEIIDLFDDYRIFYQQTSNKLFAKQYLKERLQNDESIIFVAILNGKAIGFTQLYKGFSSIGMKPLFTLNDLFVAEGYRNLGAGKALLDAAVQLGKSLSWRGMVLETAHNNPARKLYEREGWKQDDEFIHYAFSLDH